jgi:predicted DCC family thiol-disulfide oxidoreductase YuxK
MNIPNSNIIFFDGVCNLCNGFIQFIIKKDIEKKFKFASLQSEYASSLPIFSGKISKIFSTVVLLHEGIYYYHSTAILKIAKQLPIPYSTLFYIIVIPAPLRDFVYKWIAKNRYSLFGKSNDCWLPSSNLKERFL